MESAAIAPTGIMTPTDILPVMEVISTMFQKMLWLALAGACGTISRYTLCEVASRIENTPVPLGTFTVNILGSFLFGLLYSVAQRKLNISDETRVIVLTGFLGAFTTFSALAFETAKMIKSAQWFMAFGNVAIQITLGILALVSGILLGRTS